MRLVQNSYTMVCLPVCEVISSLNVNVLSHAPMPPGKYLSLLLVGGKKKMNKGVRSKYLSQQLFTSFFMLQSSV